MKKIKRAIKRFILKRELKYWWYELESLELALEYCNEVPDDKTQQYLGAVHECRAIINGLKLILKKTQ